MATSLAAMGKTVAEITAAIQKMTQAQVAAANAAQQHVGYLQQQHDHLTANADKAKEAGQWAANTYQTEKKRLEIQRQQAKRDRASGAMSQEEYERTLQQVDAEWEKNEAADASAAGAQKAAKAITGVSGAWKGTTIGRFFQGDFEENLERTRQALVDQFSAANILGSSLMKVQEATVAMVWAADAQFAKTNQLTNSTGEYNDMIMNTMQNNAEWNVSMEVAGEAVGDLYTEMSQFTEMTEEAQGNLVEATAQLNALGIDTKTTAANMEILNKALGMSAEQAIKVQKDFAAMAADLGVSAGKIAKDFEANASVFTAYGDEATKVFKEVAAAAKATGIEMKALLGITTQFDTFEGAANAAGKLNSVLGGGVLNSMDLLNASEEERIRLLIQSIQLSGKSWDSMNKFEKMAVANAAGISDMTEANKVFGTTLAEYDKQQRKVEDNAEAQKKLEERAAAATSAQDKLKRIFEQFAVAVQPILSFVHGLLDGFLALNDMTGGMLIPTLIGLGAAYMLLKKMKVLNWTWSSIMSSQMLSEMGVKAALTKVTGWLSIAQNTQTTSAAAGAPASKALAKGIKAIGKAATKYLPAIFSLGMALMGLALAVAAPIILVAVIIWSLKELVLAFLEMPKAIMPALVGLAAFIGLVSVGLPILGLAIVGFFWVLTLAIKPMGLLTPVLPQMIGALLGLGIALYLLGLGIKQFIGDDMPGAMMIALVSLIAFGIGLAIVSKFLNDSAWKVGLAVGVLGLGLIFLGKGVKEFNDVTWPAIGFMIVSLILMGVLLKVAAKFMETAAWKVGLAVGVLGIGLLLLGMGVKQFNDVTWDGILMMVGSLIVLGILLEIAGKFVFAGAMQVGLAVGVLGLGLLLLAKGVSAFEDYVDVLIPLAIVLAAFGWALIPAGWSLAIGGGAFMLGATAAALGLHVLHWGVKPWADYELGFLPELGKDFRAFGWAMLPAGWALLIGGVAFMFGAVMTAAGLAYLWLGVQPWVTDYTLGYLPQLGKDFYEFASWMMPAGWALLAAGVPMFFGGIMMAIALLALNLPLRYFGETLAMILPHAKGFGMLAMGFIQLGWALPTLAWGLLKLGFAASMPFMSTGLKTLRKALSSFADALSRIPPENATALGALTQGLTGFTDLKGVAKVLRELGWGILWLAWALHKLPESKTVAFSVAADSMVGLIDSAIHLQPEHVDNVKGMAVAARDYAKAQRHMKSADKDAFVQALREVIGGGKGAGGKGGKSGQDIVLNIDGDEFARAVDAAIDSKHGLKGF